MVQHQVQWGTVTLDLDNETFRKAFRQGRSMYFDDCEYDIPHVAHQMNTLDAVGSVLDEDGKGGYRFDRMAFNGPFDILGFAPSLYERPNPGRKRRRAPRTHEARRHLTGRSVPNQKSFVACSKILFIGTGLVPVPRNQPSS
jgi:hypothetical protein